MILNSYSLRKAIMMNKKELNMKIQFKSYLKTIYILLQVIILKKKKARNKKCCSW